MLFLRRTIGLLFVVVIIGASPSSAQRTLDATVGVATPLGTLSQDWRTGPAFSLSILQGVSPTVGLGLSMAYSRMPLEEEGMRATFGLPAEYELSGGSLGVFAACGEVRVRSRPTARIPLYACGGLGLFQVGFSPLEDSYAGDTRTTRFSSHSRLGQYLGAGCRLPASPTLSVGLDVRYHVMSTSRGEGPIDLDDTRSWLTIQAGATIRL